MGVPSFFRWLHRQYPMIISNCIERLNDRDSSQPNPNTEGDKEFDCLYLDMNGIIHPCFHPEGIAPPRSEEEIFYNLNRYILRLFNIVRPRQLLFMAIDGVAPRAKMNQQRMRRFRSAKDNAYNRLKNMAEAEKKGDTEQFEILSDPDYLKKHDSNVITPGTEFFQRLSAHLHKFIKDQIKNDPGWQNIMVILSDASVPGEGEHKIMKYIRSQRHQIGYDPNRRHVIYGLDADLIFLGLASHEAYFTIIRENVIDMTETNPEKDDVGPEYFHFLNLWVLRQYLERDLRPDHLSIEWNLEFALDDFIFLCFGAGNDFIPSMPGFSVHSGAIRTILRVYKKTISQINRWVTQNGCVDFYALTEFFKQFTYGEAKELETILYPDRRALKAQEFVNSITDTDEPVYKESDGDEEENSRPKKSNSNATTHDPRLLKEEYYAKKFGLDNPHKLQKKVPTLISEFVKGMLWILNYYLYGVPSWDWYYPYHHSPCSSDMGTVIQDYNFYQFNPNTQPFKPLIQLMSVLPPQSAHALPSVIAYLMTDKDSPLHEYYPTRFKVDLNGSCATWHGVVRVPFIDEKKLNHVIETTDLALTANEIERNKFGVNYIFMNQRLAPERIDKPVPVNGPFVWGQLRAVPGETYTGECRMYIIDFPMFHRGMPVSFILPGVQFPPIVIEGVINTHKYDTFYDRNTIDAEAIEKSFEIPLQIPGYAPGASMDSRKKIVEKVKYFQQQQQRQNLSPQPPMHPSMIPPTVIPPTVMPPQPIGGVPMMPPGYPPPGYPPAPHGYPQQAYPGYHPPPHHHQRPQ
ncbi:5'-3' exoribonuclease 2 [Tritrichomonas foetus]|uniref:5'-3' exoribonuclease 2 n=1 Tax=Tritrichomonas foetus TaxID=1144522 RepID=A0A1J4JEH2_9EUKA|nr:5'-3' exoribonuclease 2 [Tritrichomonas foetus]|eukprot:OHS95837.1 5'-3' exoribonuclease 2 [Tritrichomonas foetus]